MKSIQNISITCSIGFGKKVFEWSELMRIKAGDIISFDHPIKEKVPLLSGENDVKILAYGDIFRKNNELVFLVSDPAEGDLYAPASEDLHAMLQLRQLVFPLKKLYELESDQLLPLQDGKRDAAILLRWKNENHVIATGELVNLGECYGIEIKDMALQHFSSH